MQLSSSIKTLSLVIGMHAFLSRKKQGYCNLEGYANCEKVIIHTISLYLNAVGRHDSISPTVPYFQWNGHTALFL